MISFGPTEEQELVRDTVREFAATEMTEAARAADEAGAVPDGFLETIWELGLVNGAIPEEQGGAGLERSPVTNAILLEELAAGDAGLAVAAMAPGAFIQAILDLGTDEQKSQYLPLFVSSTPHAAAVALHDHTFTFDASSLRTVAEPKGDDFQLSGAKRLVPLGDRASHFLVVARAGAKEGIDGIDAFVVERDAPGLTISDEQTMGLRAVPFSRIELDRVEVPASARLGGDAGLDPRRLLSSLRAATGALCVGLSRAVMDSAIPYARERVAFGQPIAQKQAIAFRLAEMRMEVDAMRWMVWKSASQLEHGLDATRSTQLAQTYTARETMKIADNGLQIFGGHGYIRDYPLEMWYRNARTLTVLEAVAGL
jgi:alkylation response protein AidB-like acyl-CoA dehydrogenase